MIFLFLSLKWYGQVNQMIVVKDVKTLVVYDVEGETAMDSMKGKCASS